MTRPPDKDSEVQKGTVAPTHTGSVSPTDLPRLHKTSRRHIASARARGMTPSIAQLVERWTVGERADAGIHRSLVQLRLEGWQPFCRRCSRNAARVATPSIRTSDLTKVIPGFAKERQTGSGGIMSFSSQKFRAAGGIASESGVETTH